MLIIDEKTGEYSYDYEGANMILKNKIKHCPFCGSSIVFLLRRINGDGEIFCPKCHFKSARMPAEEIIAIWNSRCDEEITYHNNVEEMH